MSKDDCQLSHRPQCWDDSPLLRQRSDDCLQCFLHQHLADYHRRHSVEYSERMAAMALTDVLPESMAARPVG